MNATTTQKKNRTTFAQTSPFGADLRRLSREWFKDIENGMRADRFQWIRGISFLLLGSGSLISMMVYTLPFWGNVGLLTIIGLCCFGLLMSFGHDASHNAVSKFRWVNDFLVWFPFAVIGVSGPLWNDRHIRLHHTLPNVPGTGIDAYSTDIVRMSPLIEWKWYHQFQWLYAPILLIFGVPLLALVEDFQLFREAKQRSDRFRGWKANLSFYGAKALHFILFVVLPLVIMKPMYMTLLINYVYITGIVSTIFAMLVIGTHVSDLTDYPEPDENGQLPVDFATLQVVTTVDWSPESKWAAWFTGGSNAHLAHHLFPGASHAHTAGLSKRIHRLAAVHGLQTNVVPLWRLIAGYFRQLILLSSPPNPRLYRLQRDLMPRFI